MNINQDQIKQINDPDGRTYRLEIDGVEYVFISVTTVLGFLLNKPALPTWSFNVGIENTCELISNEAQRAIEQDNVDEFMLHAANMNWLQVKKHLRDTRQTHDAQAQSGADRGIIVHRAFECRIKGIPLDIDETKPYKSYIKQMDKFLKDYNPEFHESEMKVVSMDHSYAGTLDTVCTIKKHPKLRKHTPMVGKKVVLDLKTNREGKVYPMVHFPQIDAYQMAYEEMGRV